MILSNQRIHELTSNFKD